MVQVPKLLEEASWVCLAEVNNNKNRQNSTLPSCFSKMFKYASKYKKAGNIFRQVKRTEGNKDKIEKKGKKV